MNKVFNSKRSVIIIGIGSDIIEISRIEKTIALFPERFLDRVFTHLEQERSNARMQSAASYAKRFAAKEAFVKALGIGMRDGVQWTDVEVVNVATGQPVIRVYGRAAELLAEKNKPGHQVVVHLSLSDTQYLAQAFVVIEVIPDAHH